MGKDKKSKKKNKELKLQEELRAFESAAQESTNKSVNKAANASANADEAAKAGVGNDADRTALEAAKAAGDMGPSLNQLSPQAAETARQEEGTCCMHKTKERSEKEYKDLINRLSRVEGQIRGIKRMVEEGAYCPDILVQVAAANAALNSFNKVLLANHIRTCVTDDIREGKEETVDELVATLQKLMK